MTNPLYAVRVMGAIILFKSHICISETVSCPKDADCECVTDEPCVLECIGKDYCKGGHTLTCRASQPCTLLCSGEQACTDSMLVGNDASSVSVQCTGGKACSGNTAIVCASNAPCSLTCDSGNCESLDVAANAASSFECTGKGCALTSSAPAPTSAPTLTPSANPSWMPSVLPTNAPSSEAATRTSSVESTTAGPILMASLEPTSVSSSPSPLPTTEPSFEPSLEPTVEPTRDLSPTDDNEYIDIVFVSISGVALCVFAFCLIRNCAQQRITHRPSVHQHSLSPRKSTHVKTGSDSVELAVSAQPTVLRVPGDCGSVELEIEVSAQETAHETSSLPRFATPTPEPKDESPDTPTTHIDESNTIKSLLKKAYVIGIFIASFVVLGLKQFSDSAGELFDDGQAFIINWFEAHHWLHILLVILLIAVAKGVGIKDPLSLRTMAVVILACQATENYTLRFVIAALIMSFQSSVAKLLEYYLVGDELQAVIASGSDGLVFQWVRKVLSCCFSRCCSQCSDESLEWLDPTWTLQIGRIARNDPDRHVMNNLKKSCCNCRGGNVCTRSVVWVIEFVLCVVWTSLIEWVSPISELFLYAHNWDLSRRNVLMIVCSELADFDRMFELGIFLSAYPDLLGGKVDSLVAKPLAWTVGYVLVMPLTLWWMYKLYPKLTEENGAQVHDNDAQANCALHKELEFQQSNISPLNEEEH